MTCSCGCKVFYKKGIDKICTRCGQLTSEVLFDKNKCECGGEFRKRRYIGRHGYLVSGRGYVCSKCKKTRGTI